MFAKSKLNSIETLISQALVDMEISHEEFVAIFKEKDKYEKMKEMREVKMKNKKLWYWIVLIQENNHFATHV